MTAIRHSSTSTDATVENKKLFTSVMARGDGQYAVSGITGTIAAALGANSSVFCMRYDPAAGAKILVVDRIKLMFTTIVAFTTPVTAGRRLALFRGNGAASSGGAQLVCTNAQKSTSYADTELTTANGGDCRIATTGALTVTGITFETDPFRTMTLVHVGAAGAYVEATWEFSAHECAPLILQPGQCLAIRNPAAMDAAGTWQLGVNVDWYEVTPAT